VFSESRWLVLAIYNMLFQLVYIVLTHAFIPVNSSSYTLTRMITTFVAYMVLMNAILLPKFVELMLGTSITLHDFSRKTEIHNLTNPAFVSLRIVRPEGGSHENRLDTPEKHSSSQEARLSSQSKQGKSDPDPKSKRSINPPSASERPSSVV
jgi:hypothetical protein